MILFNIRYDHEKQLTQTLTLRRDSLQGDFNLKISLYHTFMIAWILEKYYQHKNSKLKKKDISDFGTMRFNGLIRFNYTTSSKEMYKKYV